MQIFRVMNRGKKSGELRVVDRRRRGAGLVRWESQSLLDPALACRRRAYRRGWTGGPCRRRASGYRAPGIGCLGFFFQAEDGIRDRNVTGVQTCALPISPILLKNPSMTSRTLLRLG